MAATAAGVFTSTPLPPRAARAQMVPVWSVRSVVPESLCAISLTVSVEFRPTLT